MGRKVGTPLERLMSKREIDPETGCWNWTGSVVRTGYGQIKVRKGLVQRTHRVMYEALVGPIPEGLDLDHLCRNRRCMNPEHLEPVTERENALRGQGPAARNAMKTHCPRGHPYSGGNLYIIPSTGGRMCRTCSKEGERRRRIAASA